MSIGRLYMLLLALAIVAIVMAVILPSRGEQQLPVRPDRVYEVLSADSVEGAQRLAREIAGQRCELTGRTEVEGAHAAWVYAYDCEDGRYNLLLRLWHMYYQDFLPSGLGVQVVRFDYSGVNLDWPSCPSNCPDETMNPTYYLRPRPVVEAGGSI